MQSKPTLIAVVAALAASSAFAQMSYPIISQPQAYPAPPSSGVEYGTRRRPFNGKDPRLRLPGVSTDQTCRHNCLRRLSGMTLRPSHSLTACRASLWRPPLRHSALARWHAL